MNILIQGMEMPTSCAECRLCEGDTSDGLCHAVGKWFDDEYFLWYQYEDDDIDESKPANCPLVSVAEGKWINNEGKVGWHCSECKKTNIYAYKWSSDTGEKELQDKYCPNCGADMRSSAQEGEE